MKNVRKKNIKIYADIVEDGALIQIEGLLNQPSFATEKIRIMPDCHAGAGCVIGFTSTMSDKVIPNIIGVDIGCGMRVAELGDIEINYQELDEFIKNNIPSGMCVNDKVDERAVQLIDKLFCKDKLKNLPRLIRSLGTLGGGNHFIEVDKGDNGMYLVIHTGSRNLGLQVAGYYQNLAIDRLKKDSQDLKNAINEAIATLNAENRTQEIEKTIEKIRSEYRKCDIPDDLCYLEGEDMQNYMHDMRICQQFAVLNRQTLAHKLLEFLKVKKCKTWESVHNYIDDKNIIRKGAIAAHKGQRVIIPMNMRDGCIIGIGKGKLSWNESAPHGAGRVMSRNEAFKKLRVDEFKKQMEGIYTTTANSQTIDEAPMAYKPMQDILKYLYDTVDIRYIIKPVYNFKAVEKKEDYRKKQKKENKFLKMRDMF